MYSKGSSQVKKKSEKKSEMGGWVQIDFFFTFSKKMDKGVGGWGLANPIFLGFFIF